MSDERLNELKNRTREIHRKAEAAKDLSDRNLARSRHQFDMAAAMLSEAEEKYQEAKQLNEQARLAVEKSRASFLSIYGEEP